MLLSANKYAPRPWWGSRPNDIQRQTGVTTGRVGRLNYHVAMVETSLVKAVRAGLAELADPTKAEDMRAYMKSEMPFYGVPRPGRRALGTRLFRAHPLRDRNEWLAAVTTLWRDATRREERYLAIDLLDHKPYVAWRTVDLMPLFDEMIVTGAWWDFVDEIAPRFVGPLRIPHRDAVYPVLRAWAKDTDRWRRRSSVICQIKAGATTDTDLLTYAIEANVADRDFFLRKAIGWALRDYAYTDPNWVRAFVEAHLELSGLSRREAMKHLGTEIRK